MSPSFLTFCRPTFWINKPPATKWTLLFLAPNAGPLSRQRAPRGKPLTARGAAGQTTRKWTASWKRFNSTPSKATSISMDFYGLTATEKKGQLFMPRQSSYVWDPDGRRRSGGHPGYWAPTCSLTSEPLSACCSTLSTSPVSSPPTLCSQECF